MKNKIFTTFIILFLCAFKSVSAQDTLVLLTGVNLKCKVVELTPTEIKYKDFDNLDGPMTTILLSTAFMVRYQNGKSQVFAKEGPAKTPEQQNAMVAANPAISVNDMSEQGRKDARQWYKGQNSGAGWTSSTSVVLSPIGGLIVGAICAGTPPQDVNLNCQNAEALRNPAYRSAYIQEAHAIKKKGIWTGLGIGSGVWLLLTLLLTSAN